MTTALSDPKYFDAPYERTGARAGIDSLVTSSEDMRILFRQIGMGVNISVQLIEHNLRVNSSNPHTARTGAISARNDRLQIPRVQQATTISIDPTMDLDAEIPNDPDRLKAHIRTIEHNQDLLVQYGCTPLARTIGDVALESWLINPDSRGYSWLINPYVIPVIDTLSTKNWAIAAKLVSNLQNMSMVRVGLFTDPDQQEKEAEKLKLIADLYMRGDRELSGNFVLISDMTPADDELATPNVDADDQAILSARTLASSLCDFDTDAVLIFEKAKPANERQRTTLLANNFPLGLNAVFTQRARKPKRVSGNYVRL